MLTLETALIAYWSNRKLTEEELSPDVGLGTIVLRIAAGFVAFALLIASLGWAADDQPSRQQLAETGQATSAMEAK